MTKSSALPPEGSLAFQIRRVHLAFDRLLTPRLARHRIKAGFWNYLRALWIQDRVTQKRLSQITSVTEVTTVALLNAMTVQGLIERERDTADRRQMFVHLTRKGRALEPILLPYAVELNHIALQGIPKADMDVCMSVLVKVAENLETEVTATQSRTNTKAAAS